MKKSYRITKKNLFLPIYAKNEVNRGEGMEVLSVFCGTEKIYEFTIPLGEEKDGLYPFHFYGRVPVEQWKDQTLTLEGDFPTAFFEEVSQSDDLPKVFQSRPLIHFTANTGWINDPNGMLYQDGVYHLFFQHNPYNTQWQNMCWGHAVSKDLLHWEQKDTVLYPDEDGTMYSGCGIINERGLLNLPKDAQIYFYTCAGDKSVWSRGKSSCQKIAYSLDGGKTVHKMEGCAVKSMTHENRDPKVYWHEESKGYYMVLYLDKNDFLILRSEDLKNWKKTQQLTFDKAWECPDFREVETEDGRKKWMFWSADGFYYLGDFDGYEFKTDYVRHEAYRTRVPYAAQTFYGTKDVISIPWLRTLNPGKLYTGAMGLPRKLTLAKKDGQDTLRLTPVDSYYEQRQLLSTCEGGRKSFCMVQKEGAMEIEIQAEQPGDFRISLFEEETLSYDAKTGLLTVPRAVSFDIVTVKSETKEMQIPLGKDLTQFSVLADGEILEISADHHLILAVVEIPDSQKRGTVTVETEGKSKVSFYHTV